MSIKKIILKYFFILFVFQISLSQQSTWSVIQNKIFDSRCVNCHNVNSYFGVQSGLMLSKDTAYKSLLNVEPRNIAAKNDQLVRVSNAGSFQGIGKSFLWEKIDASKQQHFYDDHPFYGSLMPLGDNFLTNGELKLIYQWLYAGAPEFGIVASDTLLNDTTRYQLPEFKPLTPPAAGKGMQFHLGPFNVRPNTNNDREFFYYWPLNHQEDLFVSRVEISMKPGSHHFIFYTFNSNIPPALMKLVDSLQFQYRDLRDTVTGLVNIYTAYSMGFHQFFAGTQTSYLNKGFPKGIALRLPKKTGFDLNSHYVNRSGILQTGDIYANLYTVPLSEVKAIAEVLNLGNQDITLPPNQTTTITKVFPTTEKINIIQLFSHAHERLKEFKIEVVGGALDGKTIYWTDDWSHPPILELEPPLTLLPGQALKAIATYHNSTSQTIRFGVQSTDEMMIIFGAYYKGDVLSVENKNLFPNKFSLEQNYPNPFNPSTVINYQLPTTKHVLLKVYDVIGREVSTLVNEKQNGGKQSVKFNSKNLSNGIYFYTLRSGNFSETKKMLLLK